MSSTIEKTKIAKLILLSDMGKLDTFKGKSLGNLELDDIPLET